MRDPIRGLWPEQGTDRLKGAARVARRCQPGARGAYQEGSDPGLTPLWHVHPTLARHRVLARCRRARDSRLGRDVAVKVLPPLFAEDPERLGRFTREAQTLARRG